MAKPLASFWLFQWWLLFPLLSCSRLAAKRTRHTHQSIESVLASTEHAQSAIPMQDYQKSSTERPMVSQLLAILEFRQCVCVCWRMGPLPQQGTLGSGAAGQRRTRVARTAGASTDAGQQTHSDYLTALWEKGRQLTPDKTRADAMMDSLTIRAPTRAETGKLMPDKTRTDTMMDFLTARAPARAETSGGPGETGTCAPPPREHSVLILRYPFRSHLCPK